MTKTREYVKSSLVCTDCPLMTGPLLVIVHFKLAAPLTLPQRKRVLQDTFPHTKRPDGDNLEKFLNDSLNGVLWDDDARIAWLLRSKSITSAKEGSTTIFVRALPDGKPNYEEILADLTEHIRLDEAEE